MTVVRLVLFLVLLLTAVSTPLLGLFPTHVTTLVVAQVPVYLSGGVLLTASAMRVFEEEHGAGSGTAFMLGILYSSAVCFLLKLCAVVLQQEGIGKNLGKKVSVRMAVGVNSTSIRAIGRILGAPRLSMRKVLILCGGPDWPTSVLTGILGLDVKKMLLGTLPVYFLVLPTCAAGAMELKKGESALYRSLAGVILALSAAAQAVALMAAGCVMRAAAAAAARSAFSRSSTYD
jgi:hypothetical protein